LKQAVNSKNFRRLARELKYVRSGFALVIGVDEAGRGPLAGPVFAGAVAILDFNANDAEFKYLLRQTNDSKKVSAEKREILYQKIICHPKIAWGSGRIGPGTIDKINILEASKAAMAAAVKNLQAGLPDKFKAAKTCCLVDGNFAIKISGAQRSIIGGDAKVFSISAASIIAKVGRDRLMARLDKKYPDYGFCRHKGYPTKEHLAALARCGLSPIHRRSFSPCAGLR